MGEDKAGRFRGGKKTARDRLYGVGDRGFWRHYHRHEKGRAGHDGGDLDSAETVWKLYEEWIRAGRPEG